MIVDLFVANDINLFHTIDKNYMNYSYGCPGLSSWLELCKRI